MKNIVMIISLLLFFPLQTWATYDVPNNNSDCPANCRQVPWLAGSDQWNGGTLPVYPSVTCTGLSEGDGTTNNASAIQTCINNASSNTAVYIPAGIYYVNSSITLKNNVVLRGAGSGQPFLPTANPSATTLKFGSSGRIRFGSQSRGSNRAITSGYTKGSTTLVVGSGHGLVTGDWILISEDPDSEIPATASGTEGTCSWCGEDDGNHLMAQYAQVTVSGNTLTLNRPLYYTFKSNLNPVFRSATFGTKYSGIENLRINGYADIGGNPFVSFDGALYCWVKNIETYNGGSSGKGNHVTISWSHGIEVRDSYFHKGRNSGSDTNYGIAILFSNSDHKIENNILRHNRHSFSTEGGGSGIAFLYNYIDDQYTDDLSYLATALTNHGAHPYMNLYEGNIASHLGADDNWGSSSHMVFFRNWLWGDESWVGVPGSLPSGGYVAIDIYNKNNYYSFVGNVLGITGMHTNWSNASLRPNPPANKYPSPSSPVVYGYGSSAASSTSINHGNYDYKTSGVAYWEGGGDHTLKNSMYYGSPPSSWWCGETPWPPIGPDVSGYHNDIPARRRYNGAACTASGVPPPGPPPPGPSPSGIPNPPSNLSIQ